jgi:hypothetical protein
MGEVARYMDYAPKAEFEHLSEDVLKHEDTIAALEYENAELRGICTLLGDRGFVVEGDTELEGKVDRILQLVESNVNGPGAGSGSESPDPTGRDKEPTVYSPETERNVEAGEFGSAEQSEGGGSDGLPATLKVEFNGP